MEVLRIPLQPINREKHVREDLGYTAVLETAADEEREPLLRHFGNVYGEFMKAMPCRVVRWMNGWVQVTAVAAFWLALLIVGKKYWVLVRRERRRARPFFPFASTLVGGKEIIWSDPPEKDDTWLTETQVADELRRLNDPALGQYPGVAVLMLREAYDAYNRNERDARDGQGPHAAAEAVERVATREHRRIDAAMAALVYLEAVS